MFLLFAALSPLPLLYLSDPGPRVLGIEGQSFEVVSEAVKILGSRNIVQEGRNRLLFIKRMANQWKAAGKRVLWRNGERGCSGSAIPGE